MLKRPPAVCFKSSEVKEIKEKVSEGGNMEENLEKIKENSVKNASIYIDDDIFIDYEEIERIIIN
jgi:hypothetical protein